MFKIKKMNFRCKVNKKSNECSLVSLLRETEEELDKTSKSSLEAIIEKYLPDSCPYEYNSYYGHNLLMNFIGYLGNHYKQFDSFENTFTNLGRELDEYYNRTRKINELTAKIRDIKSKLGIR